MNSGGNEMSYMIWAQKDESILALETRDSREAAVEIASQMVDEIGADPVDWNISSEYQDWRSGINIRIENLSGEQT